MITLKTPQEIEIMREGNRIIAELRELLRERVLPGVSTLDLDKFAEDFLVKRGAKPAFKGYQGFPATLCTSVNHEVVHGIPAFSRKLVEGDIIGLDMGCVWKGYYADTAITCAVGEISDKAKRLLKVTQESLYRGIDAAVPGGRLNDIGAAVQEHVEQAGYGVVREFVGHGIGQKLHEDPQVPNYGKRGTGILLRAGMVLAIEPMVNEGKPEVRVLSDGWTAVTVDGGLSAHFEHTIAILEDGPEILTRVH